MSRVNYQSSATDLSQSLLRTQLSGSANDLPRVPTQAALVQEHSPLVTAMAAHHVSSGMNKKELLVYSVFSTAVSGVYGVLAYPRGQGNAGLSWFYLLDSSAVNFPQYVFMPGRCKDNVMEVWKNKDFIRALFAAGAGAGTLVGSFPLSKEAAKTFAGIIGVAPTLGVTLPVITLFGAALAVTRITGTLALSKLAHENLLRPLLAKTYQQLPQAHCFYGKDSYLGSALSGEYQRRVLNQLSEDITSNATQFIAVVNRHLSGNPQAAIISDTGIDKALVERFYEALNKTHFPKQASCEVKPLKVLERVSQLFLIATFMLTVPMWLALAEAGTQSKKNIVDWAASAANMLFMLWFCVLFPGGVVRTTLKLSEAITEKTNMPKVSLGIALLAQVLSLGLAFVSGFGYLNVGLSMYNKDFEGTVDNPVLQQLMTAIQFFHHVGLFRYDVAADSGLIANGGANNGMFQRTLNYVAYKNATEEKKARDCLMEQCAQILSAYQYEGDINTLADMRSSAMLRDVPNDDVSAMSDSEKSESTDSQATDDAVHVVAMPLEDTPQNDTPQNNGASESYLAMATGYLSSFWQQVPALHGFTSSDVSGQQQPGATAEDTDTRPTV